jgi:hypothetical protein
MINLPFTMVYVCKPTVMYSFDTVSGMVDVPEWSMITIAEAPMLYVVPLIAIGGSPARSVCPARMIRPPVASNGTTEGPMVMGGVSAAMAGIGIVEVPFLSTMTTPEGPRLIVVPPTVTGG